MCSLRREISSPDGSCSIGNTRPNSPSGLSRPHIRSSGLGIGPYANHYITVAGIGEKTALTHELRCLFMTLQHLIEYDHLDVPNIAGAEFISRRILQIQKAVKRNLSALTLRTCRRCLVLPWMRRAALSPLSSTSGLQESRRPKQ